MSRLLLLAALVLALAACGSDDDESTGAPATTAPATTEAAPTETEATTTAGSAADCKTVQQPAPRPNGTGKAPTEPLDPAKTYSIVVETSCGDFTITIDQKASPKGAASFVALAEDDFFNGTFFHRIIPGFVIQGGDPSGTGTGGPGYLTVDKPAADTTYLRGTVAMAKSGADPPGAAGSQFFVVTGPDAGLPPEYAVIGHVTEGEDVVQQIGLLGAQTQEGTPTQTVLIDDMVVTVS